MQRSSVSGHLLASSLFGSGGFLVGIIAHFYLVLIVGIVQDLIIPPENGADPIMMTHGGLLTGHQMAIFILVTGSLLMVLSYMARWSWPIVSEKAIFTVLFWLLYGVVIGNFGFCLCCSDGAWASYCGHVWYQHAFSITWVLALFASYGVDSYSITLRKISLGVTIAVVVLLLVAPLNACSALPAPTFIVFLKITLFHLIWHSNRLLRIAESTLYNLYTRHMRRLNEVRIDHLTQEVVKERKTRGKRGGVPSMPLNPEVDNMSFNNPQDILSAWRIMAELNATLSGQQSQQSRLYSQFIGIDGSSPAGDATSKLVTLVEEARAALPHLDHYAQFPTDSSTGSAAGSSSYIDWKYRHYSHQLMFVIDAVRSSWVLSVCAPYASFALIELVWLWHCIYKACTELVSVLSVVKAREASEQDEIK